MTDNVAGWMLRSRTGFLFAGQLCGFGGFLTVLVQLWLTGILGRYGDATTPIVVATLCYVAAASLVGGSIASAMQRRYLGWYVDGRGPSPVEASRVLRLPKEAGLLNAALWLPGIVLEGILVAVLTDGTDLATAVLLVCYGAIASSCFAYLVFDRLLRSVVPQVATVSRSIAHPSASALVRVAITWVLSSGLPLATLLLILTDVSSPADNRIVGALLVTVVAVFSGSIATLALARAVALPLHSLRGALSRIADGDLEVSVPVESTSEIGLLETAVNDMTESLRERERLRDVFGRHVGANVAERALHAGVDLSGDLREVTVLFVDVVGSTELAHRTEPRAFVDKLNRLLATVIDATDANHGLVNKFEGDAALCIFGAPIELADDAGAALRAARTIRDRVLATGELDVGIGVARGTAFAGDIGTSSRSEFTVIGDPVNEAARLTEAAKAVPHRILASQAVTDAADSDERDLWVPHGVLRLRGRTEETKSWTDSRGPTRAPQGDSVRTERVPGRAGRRR